MRRASSKSVNTKPSLAGYDLGETAAFDPSQCFTETPGLQVRQLVPENVEIYYQLWTGGETWNYASPGSAILIAETDPLYALGYRVRIFDGAHRVVAAKRAKAEHPNLPCKVLVHLFSHDMPYYLAASTARWLNHSQHIGNVQSLTDDLWSLDKILASIRATHGNLKKKALLIKVRESFGGAAAQTEAHAIYVAYLVAVYALFDCTGTGFPQSALGILFGLQVRVHFRLSAGDCLTDLLCVMFAAHGPSVAALCPGRCRRPTS